MVLRGSDGAGYAWRTAPRFVCALTIACRKLLITVLKHTEATDDGAAPNTRVMLASEMNSSEGLGRSAKTQTLGKNYGIANRRDETNNHLGR